MRHPSHEAKRARSLRVELVAGLMAGCIAACGGAEPAATPESGLSPSTPSLQAGAAAVQPSIPATAGAPAITPAANTPVVTAPAVTPPPVQTTQPGTATPPAAGADSQWCGVKRTLDARCTACHNEQKVAGAPMALKTYADLMAPAVSDGTKKVFQMVGLRVHDTAKPMPPQETLTTDQLTGIDGWVAAGAPPGADPTCSAGATPGTTNPETTVPADDWPTNCDATYKIFSHGDGGVDTPYTVPAGGEIHPQIAVPAPWGSEQLQMIAFRSITDNPKVLHHWILYGPNREHLVGWAPGKDKGAPLPADVGMFLPGGNLNMDMHYNNLTGTTAEKDHSGVEVCVLKKANFRKNTAAVYGGFSQFQINIPAHATAFDVTGNCTVGGTAPVTLLTVSPHAHTLANHMKFTLTRASGEAIVMHDRAFDFSEQQSFALPMPLVINAGDKITTTCTYANPSDKAVTFGENTGNEMCFNFATYYPKDMLSCSGAGAGGFPTFP